jgi:hypothetical protein
MSTITQEQQEAIKQFVFTHHLPSGLGNKEEACSIAAINLALSGELTDMIPNCMSPVIGRWIIGVQDSMPDAMRNSDEWRGLLPLAAGTGREHEARRSEILLNWMWDVVLPELQPIADRGGYGIKWKAMTTEKTAAAARYAADAAAADADAADADAAAAAADAADAARYAAARYAAAADAAAAAAAAARYAAAAADAAAAAAAAAARYAAAAAADAADAAAADAAADAAARKRFWDNVNPIAVLHALIDARKSA